MTQAAITFDTTDLAEGLTGYASTQVTRLSQIAAFSTGIVADVAACIHNTGAEDIGGLKTFDTIPKITTTAPTLDTQVAGKKYVDDQIDAISIDGAAEAWVVFDGTGANEAKTPGASFNITSVVKTATGKYTITWDTDFASANYALSGMAVGLGSTSIGVVSVLFGTVPAAGSVQIQVQDDSGALQDSAYISVIAFGAQ